MYSDIIQLETRPISETGTLTTSYFDDEEMQWFFYDIADSVRENDYPNTIDHFISYLQLGNPYVEVFNDEKEKWIVFHEGFVRSFFEWFYPSFEEYLLRLVENASIEAFCNGFEMKNLLYPLNMIVDDKYGIYIMSSEMGLQTLDRFIRRIEPEKKYYIGGTVEYHS